MPINTPVLEGIDHEDGSGLTADVHNASDGSTNTVFVQPAVGGGWTAYGQFVADANGTGSVAAGVEPGAAYWVHVRSVLGAEQSVSNLVLVSVTHGIDSQHYQLLTGVRDRLITMNLRDIEGKVYVQKFPNPKVAEFPCVIIVPIDFTRIAALDTCGNFLVEKPASVCVCHRDDPDYVENLPLWLYWREQIECEFFHNRLNGLNGLRKIVLNPQPVLHEKLADYQYVQMVVALSGEFKNG